MTSSFSRISESNTLLKYGFSNPKASKHIFLQFFIKG